MDLSGLSRRPGLLHLPIYRLAFLAVLELLQRGKGLGKGSGSRARSSAGSPGTRTPKA